MKAEHLGAFIKRIRVRRKLKQVQLAAVLGCCNQQISNWERGKGSVPLAALVRLRPILKLSNLQLELAIRRDGVARADKRLKKLNQLLAPPNLFERRRLNDSDSAQAEVQHDTHQLCTGE